MNTTSIESKDQIIYYTNFHFLEDSPSTNNITIRLNYDPTSLVESIYYDGQYVYGRLGEVGYNDSNHNFYSYISVTEDNGTYILNIQLKNWETFAHDYEYMSAVNSRFDYESEAPNLIDIRGRNKPLNTGIHRFAIVLRCPTGLSSIPSNLFDIKAKLSNYDDSINTFTQITEYITTKQKLDEKAPMMQTDGEYRNTPSQGLQSGKQSYAGKKVLDSAITWDGFRYHSMRFVMIGVDQYDMYEDMDGDLDVDYDDAVGLATYMVVNDAGTKHETSTIIQHMIGPAGNSSEQQPSKLCPRYSMTSLNLESLLFDSSNIRLSHDKTNSNSAVPLNLNLQFSKEQLSSVYLSTSDYSNSSLTEQSFLDFVNSVLSDVTIEFSLSGTLVISSSNDTIFLDADRLTLYLDEYSFSFDKFLQKMSISYSDGRDLEEITIHLMTHIVTHTDPMALHTSYHKIGQYSGFTIYDYVKIRNIAQGLITPPQHVNLGLFSSISTSLRAIKGAFFTVVGAVEGTLDKFTCRFDSFREKVSTWFDNAAQSIQNTMAYIGNIVAEFVDKLIVMVNNVVTLITDAITECLEGLVEFLIYVMENPELFYNRCRNPFKNFLAKASAWFSNVFKKVGKFFMAVGKALKDFFKMVAQIYIKILKFQASMWADLFRIQLLFLFSILFGTNVGLHETADLKYLNGEYVFDNETAEKYPQVYKLDHVLDVIAGRTDLEGEVTEHGLEQGMGEDAEPNEIANLLVDIGCEIFEKLEGEDVVFGDFKWVHSVEDGNQWDHYFGLRKKLRLFGIPLFSENTFIMICEIVLGILPLGGLIQDVKDTALEPMKFFRIFAAVMIPLDITELFGNVLSQIFGGLKDLCSGDGVVGTVLGGIKKFISNVFNKIGKGLKKVLEVFLKVAKYAAILFIALLTMVTIIIIPASAIAIVGLATVFILIFAFVSFLVVAMKFLMRRIMKPLFNQMIRGVSWMISKIGDGMKRLFREADNLTKGTLSKGKDLLVKLKDKVTELFGKIFQKIKDLWEVAAWKPWKNKRMPWCVACYSNLAKKNIHNVFEVIKNSEEIWYTTKNLTPSAWDAIKNGAEFGFPEDILKKEAIEEAARLISPGNTVDELFGETGEWASNPEFRDRWADAISAFQKSYKETIGDLIAKIAVKESLQDLQKQLGKNNFIDKAIDGVNIKNLDDLVNDPEALTKIFKNNENFQALWKFYQEQGNERIGKLAPEIAQFIGKLNDAEAKAYTKGMLVLSGCDEEIMLLDGVGDSRQMAEPFQKAWIKLRASEDEIRKAWLNENISNVLIKGRDTGRGTHTGFDDVFLALDNDGKYIFRVIELKVNSIYSPYIKLTDNLASNAEIAKRAQSSAKDFMNKLISEGIDMNDAERIMNALFERSRLSANVVGLDFLRKVSDGSMLDMLKDVEPALSDEVINSLLEGMIKQNQLISFMENGATFKIIKKDGYWTVAKNEIEDVVDIIDLKFIPSSGQPVDIFFDAKVFKVDYDQSTNLLKKPRFPGPDIDFDKLTTAEKAAYTELNQLIDEALNGFDLSIVDEYGSLLPPNMIAGKVNEIQSLIYSKIICKGVFDEFQIFKGGTVDFCIETMGEAGSGEFFENYLKAFFDRNGIVTYQHHQHWEVPFAKFRRLFSGTMKESDKARSFRERWFRTLLENSNYDVSMRSFDEIEEIIFRDPEIGERLLRNFHDQYKVPNGHFWRAQGGTNYKKGIVFFNKETGEEIVINGEKAFMTYDLKHILDNIGMKEPILMNNPITFGIYNGRMVVDFNCDRNAKIATAWIERLRTKYNIPESTLKRLEHRMGYGGGVDLLHPRDDDEMIKLFALILAEFQSNWDEAASYIQDAIKKPQNWGTDTLRNNAPEVTIDVFGNIKIGEETIDICFQSLTYGNKLRDGAPIWCLPGSSSFLGKIINDIKIQTLNTVFSFPGKPSIHAFFDWITANWHAFG